MMTPKLDEELYQFVASDYFATGEGSTISLLITRAYAGVEDWEERPSSVNDWTGKLKYGKQAIATRIFVEKFGSYLAHGAENLSREEFLEKYGEHLPTIVLNLLTSEDQPGNLSFSQQLHFNFS